MSDSITSLEREYEIKRNRIKLQKEQNLEKAYEKAPRLVEIDAQIKQLGIKAAKVSLANTSTSKDETSKLLKEIDNLNLEKTTILKKENIDLEPNYECTICKDTGYITKNGITQMCTCMKQKLIDSQYNKLNRYKLEDETFENFNFKLYPNVSNLEKYKTNKTPRENMENIVKLSKDFIENYDLPETKNLLFVGSTGVGKTFLSGCIANEFIKRGRTVIYQTAPLLLDLIFEYKFNQNKNQASKEIYESLFDVDLLIIDDLGTENPSSAKFAELFTIINSRLLTSKTKTIISSNLEIDGLNKAYDDRIISRFVGQYTICRFFGEDIRKRNQYEKQ